MSPLAAVLVTLSVLLLVPAALATLVLAGQVAAWGARAWAADTGSPGAGGGARAARRATGPSLAVLVPAHDEASVITSTLATIIPQLLPQDRVLVVADNCGDETAELARAAGAEVFERRDTCRRGKGYALAQGVTCLREAPPDVVVVVDADCQVMPGGLDALALRAATTGRPTQALYLMKAPAGAALGIRMAEFAWRVRNLVRPAGGRRLGMPCQLMGSGMAFPWALIADAPLANASIVEDLQLGIDLALQGHPPELLVQACVTSDFPESREAAKGQRTRWEHGHLETLIHQVPRLLRGALVRRDPRLAGQAADLAVPPLALLVLLVLGTVAMSAAACIAGAGPVLLAASGGVTVVMLLAVLRAWQVAGRDVVSGRELLSIPAYVARKFPLYIAFVFKRQKAWVRTERR